MKNSSRMLLVGVWANRNWILGNWLREVTLRSHGSFQLWWVISVFAQKKWVERLLFFPLPRRDSYFFSYITIFERYIKKNPNKYGSKSLVLFTHAESEIGTVQRQVEILNKAFAVYFFCSQDADRLVMHGLEIEKVRLAFCAVDDDCIKNPRFIRREKTVVLASKFGWRKGLSVLPEVVALMPEWNFIALGRGWEGFIQETGLDLQSNFSYFEFNKSTRNKHFCEARIFLSLSSLEGGPVPLIEAVTAGAIPVATKTGFAPDLIQDKIDGVLIDINPSVQQVVDALISADKLSNDFTGHLVHNLTWDRITRMMLTDQIMIQNLRVAD